MAVAVPPISAERSRPTAAGSFARRVGQRVPLPVAEALSFAFSSPPWLEVGHLSYTSRLLTTGRATVRLLSWIRAHFPAAHAIRPAASSYGPVAAPVGFCVQCRCGKSLLRGYFGSVQSWHLFVSRQGSLLDLAMADAVPPASAERFRPAAAGSFARHVGRRSCMARLLTTSGAIVPLSHWIRSPCHAAHAIRPAASSKGPLAAPVGCCARRGRRGRLLQGYFGCVQTWHLSFFRQEGTHSLLDLCSCAARFAFPGCSAKQVQDACMVALTKGRAIVQVSGWIRPPSAPVPRILPSPAGAAHDKRKQRRLAGFIGVHHQNVHAPELARRAHKSSSERAKHSVSCMRFPELAPSRCLLPVRVARKKDPVLRSSGSVAAPSPMKSMPLSPSPSPSAACVLRLQGAVRSVFRPDIEEAVEANWLVISPVDETLRQAQVPFILMIRHLLPLLPSEALQGREALLRLVLVGHSHGGVVGHSLAQILECAGFLVKGIVAIDTLGLPRWSGMPLPRFDTQGLIRNLSPYHWQLTAPMVNMMAPEVPPFRRLLLSRAELLVGGAVFPPKYLKDVDHFQILQQSSWDLAVVVSRTLRRHSGQPHDRRIRLQASPVQPEAVNRCGQDSRVQRPSTRSDPQPSPRQHPQSPQCPQPQRQPRFSARPVPWPQPGQWHPAALRHLPPLPPWASPYSTLPRLPPPTDHPQLRYASPPPPSLPPSHAHAFTPHPPKYPSCLSSPRHLHLSSGTTPQPQASAPSSCSVPCGAPSGCRLAPPRAAFQRKPRFLI
ncbi:unnamed protein product [Symbiodinium sp. CCMP2592]|nr:unnamed protein product [Symbiodinium sp. CCMP2592]